MNCVLESIKNAKKYEQPWTFYEVSDVLSPTLHSFVREYDFPDNEAIKAAPEKFCLFRKFDRIKSIVLHKQYTSSLMDNKHSCEISFTESLRKQNTQANNLFSLFCDPELIAYLENIGPYSLKGTYLRVQLIKDLQEYAIRPHVDGNKYFTLFLHYCTETEKNLGTDLYDTNGQKFIKTSTFKENGGMFFFPSKETWHGYRSKPINKQRISLMVNYFSKYPKKHNIIDEDNAYYQI